MSRSVSTPVNCWPSAQIGRKPTSKSLISLAASTNVVEEVMHRGSAVIRSLAVAPMSKALIDDLPFKECLNAPT
jgi:hypothetical protein